MNITRLLATLIVVFMFIPPLYSSDPITDEEGRKYLGVAKCQLCHKKEKKGLQFEIWKESRHSKAYERLATPEAIEIAKKRGVENPQEDPQCLKCHTAGYDAPAELRGRKFDLSEGVGCEACHGAGGDYSKSKIMKGVRAGTIEPASVGLIMPDEQTCKRCHNEESPNPKEFDFDKMWVKIAHPIPKK